MEPERAREVAARLLASPALAGLTPLEKEEQALLLLRVHAEQMAELLSGAAYLPGLPWEQARKLLSEELRRQTDRELGPLLEEVVRRDGVFPFAAGIQSTPISSERCRQEITALLEAIRRSGPARAALSAPLAAAWRDLPGRYLPRCYDQRQYVHFELTKVERLRLRPEEAASFVRAALLLRAGVFLAPETVPGGLGPRFASEAMAQLRSELKTVPQAVLRSAVLSHLPCRGNPLLPASARLTAIFAAAACAAHCGRLRGALPPEQSWLGIARRNAPFHGLDGAMLEELHGIASRNGW